MTPTTSFVRALSCCAEAVASAARSRSCSSPNCWQLQPWNGTSLTYEGWMLSGVGAQAAATAPTLSRIANFFMVFPCVEDHPRIATASTLTKLAAGLSPDAGLHA